MLSSGTLGTALRTYWEDMERCRWTKAYWSLLHVTAWLPDICAALESGDGKARARKPEQEEPWIGFDPSIFEAYDSEEFFRLRPLPLAAILETEESRPLEEPPMNPVSADPCYVLRTRAVQFDRDLTRVYLLNGLVSGWVQCTILSDENRRLTSSSERIDEVHWNEVVALAIAPEDIQRLETLGLIEEWCGDPVRVKPSSM